MKILLTGASGLIGSALAPELTAAGHEVIRLRRSSASRAEPGPFWDPVAGTVEAAALLGVEGIVHLAGASVAEGRWTAARKQTILDSREAGTRLIAESAAHLRPRPKVLVCASAIGFYGDRGEERLSEASPPGSGFLADVCRRWEAAAEPARAAGVRVVHLRFGVVLSPAGGALRRMLTPFRMGLGGRLGSGRQFMSWITLEDAVGAIVHAIKSELEGPVNVVAPNPVRNAEFSRLLARALGRPAILPMPAPIVRLAFGEMGHELMLSSARVEPARLQAAGYAFRHPELEEAFRHLLGRSGS